MITAPRSDLFAIGIRHPISSFEFQVSSFKYPVSSFNSQASFSFTTLTPYDTKSNTVPKRVLNIFQRVRKGEGV